MTLAILLAVALALALYAGVDAVLSVSELKAKREEAGGVLIKLRDEAQAEGFAESAEFDEKWDKAEKEYADALEAEEKAAAAETGRKTRAEIAERVRRDAERIGALSRRNMRPDYNPASDPRSRGITAFPTAQEWGVALKTWAAVRSEDFDPSDEDVAILKRCRVNMHADSFRIPTGPGVLALVMEAQEVFAEMHPNARARAIRQVLASWNTVTPESGGYVTEPPQIIRQLEVNRLAWGGLLQVATIKQTTTGEEIILPFTDDTTVKGRRITEDGPLGVDVSPRFGQIKWGAYKYTSDLIVTTYEMMRDAFFNLETFIGDIGGQRLGRIQNYECTVGNGASMPRGIVFSAPIGVTTASATAITTDEVIDLEMSVDDAYKNGDRVGYMMNKGILKYLRKLKDGQGRPFYILGQETGGKDQLNNYPIYMNYDMDNTVATGKDVMLFGDFSKYWIRRVGGSRVVRDPYTQRISNDRDLFAVVEYADGNLVNAGTAPVKKMRML